MNIEAKLTRRIVGAAEKLRVKSALNPALWLCAIVTIPTVFMAVMLSDEPPVWLIVMAFIPVIMATLGFLFLLIVDRDKLQSEDYQLRKRSLELIQEKGQKFPVQAASINLISNPDKPDLPSAMNRLE